jgi:ketosteroid isomerase-like protein
MSVCHQNKASLVRFVEIVCNRGALELVNDLVAADYIGQWPADPAPVLGPTGVRRRLAECRRALPDLYVKVDALIAEEDRVAIVWRATGGRADTDAGTTVQYEGLSVVRLLAGKLVESRTIWRHDAKPALGERG